MIKKEELLQLLTEATRLTSNKGRLSKDLVLSFLFFKYIGDIYSYRVKLIIKEFGSDQRSVSGRINRFPLVFDKESTFDYFYKNKDRERIVEIVKTGMIIFKSNHKNDAWLSSILTAINLDYIVGDYFDVLGNKTIKNLLELFGKYDFSGREEYDIFGVAFEFMHGYKYSFQSFRDYIGM